MTRKNPHAVALGRLGGRKGGKISMQNRTAEEREEFARSGGLAGGRARARSLNAQQRKEIAKKAAAARWGNRKEAPGGAIEGAPTEAGRQRSKRPSRKLPDEPSI